MLIVELVKKILRTRFWKSWREKLKKDKGGLSERVILFGLIFETQNFNAGKKSYSKRLSFGY